ncbi:MAG: hypothetical protein NAOJABEB_02971 [Steroidobacteraceae bacterium]|nr:hypothetical protein [Steroidobacteraceae bacterium]
MVTKLHDIPGNFVDRVPLESHAAATATEKRLLWIAPFAVKIVSIVGYFDAASTGDTTNSTNINLINGGTDGIGTTEIGNIDYATGTNIAIGTAQSFYAPASPVAYAAGTHIIVQFEKVSSGLLIGRGTFVITYQAN